MIKQDERTYCQECAGNYGDDAFDYRFDYPVCHKCVAEYKLTKCNWCEAEQEGNLSDTCQACNKEGYLMDYQGGSK